MNSNALYYPHIGLSDASWIKAMSLLYDNIYRIVPDNVIPDDNSDLHALLEEGSVGRVINPKDYAKSASDEFLNKIEEWDAAALSFNDEDIEYSRIHTEKIDYRVRELFRESGYSENNGYVGIPTELASNFMLYLARDIASKNDLNLITPDWGAWTGTTYFDLNGGVDEFIVTPNKDTQDLEDPFGLFCLIVSGITPINISEVPDHKIVEFREKRKDEIANFRNSIFNLISELESTENSEIKLDIVQDKVKELDKAKEEFQKSADLIKAKKWIGTPMMGFPAPISFAALFNLPISSTIALGTTGIVLGALFNISNTEEELKKLRLESPGSLLFDLEKDFKNYTNVRGGGDINFHAYNCMEEYVND